MGALLRRVTVSHNQDFEGNTPTRRGPISPQRRSDSDEEGDIDRPPPHVWEALRRAFEMRIDDVPVADLVFDSLVDIDPRLETDPRVRQLQFKAADTNVRVTVRYESVEQIRVDIRLFPAYAAVGEVRGGSAPLTFDVNDDGRAELEIEKGLVSFVLRPAPDVDRPPLQTAWVSL
jgi:hypothetical protein